MNEETKEALRTIGATTNNAAVADIIQFNVFLHLSGLDIRTGNAIYFALDAEAPKQKIIRRLVDGKTDRLRALVEKLFASVSKASNARNTLAHSALMFDLEFEGSPDVSPGLYNPKQQKAPLRHATEPTLNMHRVASVLAVQECQAAYESICHEIGVPPEVRCL